ncbi:hypothetical protein Ancab_004338 [Ancistrocladus abbreviatus]
MGGILVLLSSNDKHELRDLMKTGRDWVAQWFEKIRPWTTMEVATERFLWIRVQGLPLNCWQHNCFWKIVGLWGKLIMLDGRTSQKKRQDIARMLISTTQSGLIAHSIFVDVNRRLFFMRVNKEISGESLYFLGEDCRPDWNFKNAGCPGSSSSSKGYAETGEFSEYRWANNQKLSKISSIRIPTNEDRACRNNTAEKCTRAASCNDDIVVKHLHLDVDRGVRISETEGLVEREEPVGAQEIINAGVELLMHKGTNERNMQSGNSISPSILPRELDWSSVRLGRGPMCRITEEAEGLSIASGHPSFSSEKGGLENTDRCTHSLPKPKKVGILSRGLVCSRNNGDCVKTSAGQPTSSGFPDARREESGNATTEKGCHLKSRPKKSGCVMPTVKLGVGARQRPCEGLKKHKKKKTGCTNSKKANHYVDGE